MEEDKFLSLINQYTDSNSCLFISRKNHIFRVYCPFRVICNKETDKHIKGSIYSVNQVFAAEDQSILFGLSNDVYPHHYFKLLS